jgi:DNA-binding GntR family transcriptional regulator
LPPGAPIVEAQVASQLGISKTPLRSALLQLEREGFVDSVPYKGSRVGRISLAAIRHLFQLREAIETYAIREAVRTFSGEELAEVEALLRTEQQAIDRQDLDEVSRLEEQFHRHFIDRLENPHLTRIAQNISDHRSRLRYAVADFRPDSLPAAVARHFALLEAIRARDTARAEQLVREAIQSALGRLERAEQAGALARLGEAAPRPIVD